MSATTEPTEISDDDLIKMIRAHDERFADLSEDEQLAAFRGEFGQYQLGQVRRVLRRLKIEDLAEAAKTAEDSDLAEIVGDYIRHMADREGCVTASLICLMTSDPDNVDEMAEAIGEYIQHRENHHKCPVAIVLAERLVRAGVMQLAEEVLAEHRAEQGA